MNLYRAVEVIASGVAGYICGTANEPLVATVVILSFAYGYSMLDMGGKP